MSIESMAACLHHSKSTGTDKVVLLGIANHDGDGGAYPSVATLAKYANVSKRTVQNSINKLIELGEVRRHVNQGGNANTPRDQRPNRYDVLVRCPADCDGSTNHRLRGEVSYNGVNSDAERGEVQRNDGVKSATDGGETDFTQTILKPSNKPSNNSRKEFPELAIKACNYFADLIEQNGSNRPNITNDWLSEMDKLNRIDKRDWREIREIIDWCQNDAFWKSRVMSPSKLRKQFDVLRLQKNEKNKSSISGWAKVIAKFENETKEIGK